VYRVVIGEDEGDFRLWLRSALEADNEFQVVGEATTGSEAISLIDRLSPDLLITDVYLPDCDGFEVAQHLHSRLPDSKAILVSAYEDRVFERLAREEGAVAFIPKSELSVSAVVQCLQERT